MKSDLKTDPLSQRTREMGNPRYRDPKMSSADVNVRPKWRPLLNLFGFAVVFYEAVLVIFLIYILVGDGACGMSSGSC
jgi:hypothetical protein